MHQFQAFKKNDVLSFNSFIQIPRELMESEEYLSLTPDAMLLFSLLTDRLALSFKQNDSKIKYHDENGNMYVIFKREDISKKLHLKRAKLDSAIKQLKDVNLIQEKKQGKNLPNIIYVSKTKSMIESAKIIKLVNAEKKQSGDSKNVSPECRKSAVHNNYNKINNNNKYNMPQNKIQKFQSENHNDIDYSKYYITS